MNSNINMEAKVMSFSATVKNELARIPLTDTCCIMAELAGLTRMCGSIRFQGNEQISLFYITENASVARRITTFLKQMYIDEVEINAVKSRQLKKKYTYEIYIKDPYVIKTLLSDIDFLDEANVFMPHYPVDSSLIRSNCCLRSYIRGNFLGAGSVTNPEKSYHLEFVTRNEAHGRDLIKWLARAGIEAKYIKRKQDFIVYIKEAELISDLLALMGASKSVFKLEDVRVVKDIRNNVNRIVNCETANLNKIVDAAIKQLEDIELLDRVVGLSKLPESLQEAAYIRKKHPQASLQELGSLLDPPVGKSGMNHRLKKIRTMANEIRGDVK